MFSLEKTKPLHVQKRLDQYLNRSSPIILATLALYFLVRGTLLILSSNGGSDLVDADIPKSLMLLHGQNPYSTAPWASPYPPLLLLVDSGIIQLTGLITTQQSVDMISQNMRLAGLAAGLLVAFIIYNYLRKHTGNPLTPLVSAGLFLTLPAVSVSSVYFFHSDTFGYPILALSILALVSHRYTIGTSLLSTASIFKIHPILALPLVLIWQARTLGLRKALPNIFITTTILTAGLIVPISIPGYTASVLGFNLVNTGNGATFPALLSLTNTILPAQLQLTPTTLLNDQVWLTTTLAILTIVLGMVWINARKLGPIDVVLLGLLAWLIPLKIEYTHYVVWAVIPILMRGQLRQTIPLLALLQVADTLSYWSWWPNTSLVPGIDTLAGQLAASGVFRTMGLLALAFTIKSMSRNKNLSFTSQSIDPNLTPGTEPISTEEPTPIIQ